MSSAFHNSTSIPGDSFLNPVTSGSGVNRQTTLSRTRSITQKFSRFQRVLTRPFTLSARATSHAPYSPHQNVSTPHVNVFTEKVIDATHKVHNAIHDPSASTFFSKALRSDNADPIALPFRLSIGQLHDKTLRNLPYLRQSWSRIDFVAIFSFWIMFVLAMSGVERGEHHIGIFRAMSVIRTARLLTITSGTTVSTLYTYITSPLHPCRLSCTR